MNSEGNIEHEVGSLLPQSESRQTENAAKFLAHRGANRGYPEFRLGTPTWFKGPYKKNCTGASTNGTQEKFAVLWHMAACFKL